MRVLREIHFCVTQNFLSLTENNHFRTSQLREVANERNLQLKMAEQHFVPKSYLKHFCTEESEKQELYASRFIDIANKWSIPKAYNVREICYKEDFYNLDDKQAAFHSVEPDILEKRAFWYEDRYIAKVISQLLKGDVDPDLVEGLPFFFLSMKARNPNFRSGYTKDKIKPAFKNALKEIQNKFKGLNPKFLEEITSKIEDDIIYSEEGQHRLHNNSLYRSHLGKNAVFNEVLEKVNRYNIVFYKITDDDKYFIVSDSPGFSVDIHGKVHNTKFKDDTCHFFPIHSKFAVGFMNPDYHTSSKEWNKTSINNSHIQQINYGSSICRIDNIYCESNSYLQKHIDFLQFGSK